MIHVTCAIIYQNNQILCAQRSETMKHSLKWEFPGGNVEEGEELEACLVREIQEELNVEVQVGRSLTTNYHNYGEGKEINDTLLSLSKLLPVNFLDIVTM